MLLKYASPVFLHSKIGMISRRSFVQTCALGALLRPAEAKGPAREIARLNQGWLFGESGSQALSKVTLPHSAAKLSWQDWDMSQWQKVWTYQRRFSLPASFRNRRVFLQFDGVLVGTTPSINGHALAEHLGGYLPFRYELTEWLKSENELRVEVDARWQNVPPEGSPRGPRSIDYLEPGGIVRGVSLSAVPQVFISDVFAKPLRVLDSDRRVEVLCTIDAADAISGPIEVASELRDGSRVISRARETVRLEKKGETEIRLTLSNLGNVDLWTMDTPRLYDVVTTLSVHGKPVHDHRVRIGFREARFDVDGFFLNGRRLQLFGLNRHELYPYVGFAMPDRVQRHDAEILKREFNCNMMRCSHYPQTEAFLDACDELGLMVWEEPPGWQYIGDQAWQELAFRDVGNMIRRDCNHPSIVIWGVRINESHNDPPLYERTRALAHSLDDSRPTSGSMTTTSTKDWHQDVFAFDDYHAMPDGSVSIHEPLPEVPYMLAEAVGQFNYAQGRRFDAYYRRAGDVALQQAQALRHAQAHDRGMSFPRCSGIIAWCGFEYGSLMNAHRTVKYPGVADVFRIPKLGASFYQAQMSPEVRPVIIPNFYWDIGPQTPKGPGKNVAIFSNCDRLEIFIGATHAATAKPDRTNYPRLRYAPFFCDLTVDSGAPDLRIEGYIGERLALSRSFSLDKTKDQLYLAADDRELVGDGSDATRLVFRVVDRYGAPRPFAGGEVKFELLGPGVIVGDNPFALADAGGAGAVWVRTLPRSSGRIRVSATHSSLGAKTLEIDVKRPDHGLIL